MKRLVFLFQFTIFFVSSLFSQGQIHKWDWLQEADSANYQIVHDIAVDTNRGWVYVVGGFENNLSSNFGGETSSGGKDGFVTKFDTLGNLIWSFDIGGSGDDEIHAIDIENSDGSFHITGYCTGTSVNFKGEVGGNQYSNFSWGGKDVFVASYESNGQYLRNQRDGGSGDDIGNDIVVLQGKNAFVYTGVFYDEMELYSTGINFGPDDNRNHMFVASRDIDDYSSNWRGFSDGNGEAQNGVALTSDGTYVYLLGEFSGDIRVRTQDRFGAGFSGLITSSTLSEPYNSSQSIYFARLKENDGEIEQTNSWFYSIYGTGYDYAGDIKYRNNKLHIGGSVSNNVVFEGGPNDPFVIGNQAFVSTHDVLSGSVLTKNNEPNIGSSTFSMVNSISFTNDYLVVGGRTNGTIRFDGNVSNDMVSLGSNDGFVAFYAQDTSFIEHQKIEGLGTNEVTSIFGRGKDVFVGGAFGGNANYDDEYQVTGQDDETGFVSLLRHRICMPSFTYAMDTVCQEAQVILPNYVQDNDGCFSSFGAGLDLDTVTGAINPYISLANTGYKIVYTTFLGCSDTVKMFVDSGYVPNIVNAPNNITINTLPTSCGVIYNYPALYSLQDCGVTNISQIDNSGYTSGDEFPVGTTTQTWVASDGYNPNDTAEFTITVIDNIVPEVNFSQDTLYLYTDSNSCNVYVDVEPLLTYSDNCGITSSLQVADLSNLNGTNFNANNTPYELIFSVTDLSSNTNQDTIYVYVLDTISPSISNCINTDTTIYLSSSSCQEMVTFNHINSSDACGVLSENWVLPQNNMFSLDTTNVVCEATDYHQNSSTCSFNVIVLDTITPVFTNCTSDTLNYYLSEDSCSTEVQFNTPMVSENCLYSINQVYGVNSGSNLGVVNLDSLIFIVNDSSNNNSTCTKYYRVLDTITPTFTNCPNDTVLKANIEFCGKEFYFDPLLTNDNCSLSGSITQVDLTGLSSGSIFPIGSNTLEFSYTDLSNNVATCTFTIEVEIQDTASFNQSTTPNGVCVNSDSLQMFNYINGYQYGDVYINGVLDSVYNPGSQQTTDTITYVYGGIGCQNTITHYINLYSFSPLAGLDDSICGLSYNLGGNLQSGNQTSYWEPETAYDFLPNNSANDAEVNVSSEGLYSFVWFVEQDQCQVSDTVLIHFFEQPYANPGENQTVESNETDLNAIVDFGTGFWTIDESEANIEDSLNPNTTITELNLGLNTFTWIIANGVCPSDTGVVRIFYDMLTIPNAFTPNGDGVNDEFKIKGFELYSDARITVLDRWGEVIYFTDQPNEAWDGKYKGKDVVDDTYFYIIFINEKEYTGYIELRR